MRHARAVMHVGTACPRWRGKRSWHSRRMRTRNFPYLARSSYSNKSWLDQMLTHLYDAICRKMPQRYEDARGENRKQNIFLSQHIITIFVRRVINFEIENICSHFLTYISLWYLHIQSKFNRPIIILIIRFISFLSSSKSLFILIFHCLYSFNINEKYILQLAMISVANDMYGFNRTCFTRHV